MTTGPDHQDKLSLLGNALSLQNILWYPAELESMGWGEMAGEERHALIRPLVCYLKTIESFCPSY